MITIEQRNLFGKWDAVKGKTFETPEAARAWCLDMADHLDIAYRILQDDQVIHTIDLEAGFWSLVNTPPRRADQSLDDPALAEFFADLADQDAQRAAAEENGTPQYDDMGLLTGYKPPSDPADL